MTNIFASLISKMKAFFASPHPLPLGDDRFVHGVNFLLDEIRGAAGYLARSEIDHILEPLRANPRRLEPFGVKVYSQNDEDGILKEIFKRLSIERGSFCEIGVENGLECNTLFLIHSGWRGAWIEGDRRQGDAITGKFASLLESRRLALGMNFVVQDNVNEVVESTLQEIDLRFEDLDFLSIDIDGNDIYLWEAIKHFPKVICIEYNAKFPPPLSKKPIYNPNNAWQGGDYMGSSLVALHELAVCKGYTLVGTNITGINAFFVRNDLVGEHFEKDATPANLYNPPRHWLWSHHFWRAGGHPADFGPYVDLS